MLLQRASGRWWGNNPKLRQQEEIDIMATRNDCALFAECKWANSDIGIDVYNELKRKSEMFTYKTVHLYLFAKNDFSDRVYKAKYEQSDSTLELYSLERMLTASNEQKEQ